MRVLDPSHASVTRVPFGKLVPDSLIVAPAMVLVGLLVKIGAGDAAAAGPTVALITSANIVATNHRCQLYWDGRRGFERKIGIVGLGSCCVLGRSSAPKRS